MGAEQGAPGGEGQLEGRTVVLGVCGGIAAYKAVELCRRLGDAGALVLPVLTAAAARFVGPVTFSALAAEPARVSLFGAGRPGQAGPGTWAGAGGEGPVPHIALARRAELVVVAPATARLIGHYAAGVASDLLSATLLATRAPVLVCPSMHTEMWEHPAVQDNVALLRRRGVHVLEPEEGRLAGGDWGKGRLPAPERIVQAAAELIGLPGATARAGRRPPGGPLAGLRATVSAGGTREPLDPVRYIGNRSSGKQAYAVAAELLARGAEVTLVSSADLPAPAGAEVVKVETAEEMADAVFRAAQRSQVVVMAAAVADYRPEAVAPAKLKKSASPLSLRLVPTTDILAGLGARRRPGQVLVGFAAETARGAELAELGRAKLVSKGADLVVANDVGTPGRGFGSEWSEAVIVSRDQVTQLGLVDKRLVASKLADAIEAALRSLGPSSGKGASRS